MKPVVISWGFNPYNGKPYLDCYLTINDLDDTTAIRMIDLRGKTQGTQMALLRIPKGCHREDIEEYISYNTAEVIETLRKARITPNDILRKKYSESNAIDFIMDA